MQLRNSRTDFAFHFGGLRLGLRQWQSRGHTGPLVADVAEPGVAQYVNVLMNQLAQFRAFWIRREIGAKLLPPGRIIRHERIMAR